MVMRVLWSKWEKMKKKQLDRSIAGKKMEKVKEKIYKYLVDSDIRIKSHYEGYIISNPEYHKEHRLESY